MSNIIAPKSHTEMEFLYLILLFSVPILILLLRPHIFKSGAGRRLSGPAGVPIFGNLLQLGPRPHQKLSEWAKLHGPLMTLCLGSVTTVVASSPDVARELLHANDQAFANRPVPDSITAQPNPEGTLAWVPGDSHWRNRRRVCTTQMFTAQRLDALRHLRHRKVGELLAHLRGRLGQSVDLGALAFATSLNLVSNTIFSVDVVDPRGFGAAEEFKELVWRIMEDAGKPNLSDYFPALRRFDLQGLKRHIRVSYVRIHEIFDDIIGKRLNDREEDRQNTTSTTTRQIRQEDFLEVLLDQCEESGGGDCGFTLDNIKPMILDLFIAGSDTSGATLEWAMTELLRNPKVLRKAQEEIERVIGKEDQIKESDTDRLPYIQAIVKETLRLHPAAPLLLPYVAGSDVAVNGCLIKKGSQLLVNAWSIGRNPNYWPNAAAFFPERFVGSAVDYKGRDFEYIPFGAGRRICPGLPLANRMVTLMLASLLYSFDWELPEGVSPESLDMTEQFGITLKKAIPLCAIPSLKKLA